MGVPHQRQYHHLEGDRVHRVSFDDTSSTQPWPQGDLVAAHVDSVPERAADPSSRDNRAVKRYGDRPDISQSKLATVASSSAAIASAIVDFPAEVEPLTSTSRVIQESCSMNATRAARIESCVRVSLVGSGGDASRVGRVCPGPCWRPPCRLDVAVRDRYCAAVVVDAIRADVVVTAVVQHGAVVDRQRAAVVVDAAAEGGAIV
jgi:hypothetical protein